MLDFNRKDLYDARKKDMKNFLENVLVTREERNRKIEDESEEEAENLSNDDILSYIGLSGGIDNVLEEDNKEEEEETFFIDEEKLGTPYELGDFWKNIAVSPYFLFYYIFRSLGKRMGNRKSLHPFLDSLVKVSAVTSIITLILVFFTDAKFLFSLQVQAWVSVSMFLISFLVLYLINHPGVLDSFRNDKHFEDLENMESDDGKIFSFGDEDSNNENDSIDDITLDDFKDLPEFGSHNLSGVFDLNNEDEDEIDVEEDEEDEVEVIVPNASGVGSPIPHSPMDVNKPMDEFLADLEMVFNRNKKYEGKEIFNRKELVMSLSDYLIANDKTFGTWKLLKERGTVYNNIMYTIYLALSEIDNRFKDAYDDENRFYVIDAKENPLMYKIEFEVPRKYFKESTLMNRIETFRSKLKKSEDDLNVNIMINTYQEGFVIKLFKPTKGFVSLGDILRFHNDDISDTQAYEEFLSEKNGLPLVLGLRNNEYPTVVDLADNTSVVIAGESGSGKSWGTFLVMMNLVFSNSYNDLNIVVMDRKKAVFWREFARLPHVVGYHTDVPNYFDIIKELKAEMEYRKQILQEVDKENWKSLRKDLLKAGEHEALKSFPWMVIIMDEISNTMNEVTEIAGTDNKHILDGFVNDLATLAQEGRSLGMKLILIGQRTIASAMPKNNLNNSSMKLFFKLTEDDTKRGIDTKNLTLPSQVGQALLQDFNISRPVLLRTLTVGGIEDDQIINLIRVLAFEWTRRSLGHKLIVSKELSFTYNRDVIREKVIKDMENGKLFIDSASSSVLDFAAALRDGKTVIGNNDNELTEIIIEKEDSFGNVISNGYDDDDDDIDSNSSPANINIKMEDDFSEPVSVKKPNSKDEMSKVDNDIVEADFEEIQEREDVNSVDNTDSTSTSNIDDNGNKPYSYPNPINSPRDDKQIQKKVLNQQMRKKSNTQQDNSSVSRARALAEFKKARQNALKDQAQTEVEEEKKKSTERFPIPYYIQTYGEGGSIKKMHRSEIEKIYTADEIKKALDSLHIVLSDDYYQA